MKEKIREFTGIENESALDELAAVSTIKQLYREECLYRVGDYQLETYFLLNGVFCFVGYDEGQGEIIEAFAEKYGSALISPGYRQKSYYTAMALTGATVLAIPLLKLIEMESRYPEVARSRVHILYRYMKENWTIKNVYRYHNAQERYAWFLATYPKAAKIAKGGQVASFLGTTRETVSRLKRNGVAAEIYRYPVLPDEAAGD